LWLDATALVLILALNLICYVRVINGYFLADDFLHVAYLKDVFHGGSFSLLKNFWSNWMQAEGTTFYRPLISLTLASDYFFFGANAAGFHLSNLFFQTASSLLLYLVVTDIGRLFLGQKEEEAEITDVNQGSYRSRLTGLAAASLFSVSPLHCEVVAWIIARVDSVACMFYLASMALFLRALNSKSKFGKAAFLMSNFSFILSLCSKEMAIILPPTLFVLLFLAQDYPQAPSTRQRFFSAFKDTLPFWSVLVFYLVFRTLALGTISGGYQGSIGEGLSNSLVKRWLSDGSFMRVLMPLNLDVFGHGHSIFKTLKLLYILSVASFGAALLTARTRTVALKSIVFALVWLVLCLLPTYQVWNLTETLQGSRFVYFATMPLAFLLALMIIPPTTPKLKNQILDRLLMPLRLVLLASFIIIFATVTIKNNQPWHHAMKELKDFQIAICNAADRKPDKNIVILNIPQSYRGAHMIYNGATMSVMLTPPLARQAIVDRVYTFEPATFGDADLISISRLRRLASMPASKNNVFYAWDRNKFSLTALKIDPADQSPNLPDAISLFPMAGNPHETLLLSKDKIALSPPVDLPASQIDTIKVGLSASSIEKLKNLKDSAEGKDAALTLSFDQGSMTLPLLKSLNGGAITFQVSEHKSWIKQGLVKQLNLKTVGCPFELEIASINACSLLKEIPTLQADGLDLIESPDGICRTHGRRPTFSYDATQIPGATGIICEVSRPNSWFEHYSGTLRDRQQAPNALYITNWDKTKGRGILLSCAGPLKDHGFYQIKIAAVDKDGHVLGYFSDPLNFQL